MKLSIVIPVYNVERYLPLCIESILSQTFTDFELLLIDDGSKDSSGEICDRYAKNDSRIRVIHKNNSGVSAARNTGIEQALGEYIIFVDSDDYVEPEYCEKLIFQIEKYPNSWCFCGCSTVDADGKYIEENCVYSKNNTYEQYPMSEYINIWKTNYSALLWIRIFKLSIILENNIRFDEKLSLSEDVLFNLEYGKFCDSFSVINLPLYNHRMYLNDEVVHLDGKKVDNMFYINKKVYSARKNYIPSEQMKGYETKYFYAFIENIKEVVKNSKYDKKEKRNRVREILHSKEFKTALKNADTSIESNKFILLLKLGISVLVIKVCE